jgi:hypothetical protein
MSRVLLLRRLDLGSGGSLPVNLQVPIGSRLTDADARAGFASAKGIAHAFIACRPTGSCRVAGGVLLKLLPMPAQRV